MQFPTIVLGDDSKPIASIPRQKFAITLDGGPSFHPTQMRREGDDALSLAVLLDASGNQKDMVNTFADSFAQLVPAFLHPQDHLSIYAQDCVLIRSVLDRPADATTIKLGMAQALSAKTLHGDKQKAACGSTLHLWDAILRMASDLSTQPGRRVILVVSQGNDGRSKTSVSDLSAYISRNGIAIFGFRDRDEWLYSDGGARSTHPMSGFNTSTVTPDVDNPLGYLCAQNGGFSFYLHHRDLTLRLQDLMTILRGRYIIEFPRPDETTAGHHFMVITVPGVSALIRSTGASAPIADSAVMADPNTLPSSPSPAKIGTHRPKEPKP